MFGCGAIIRSSVMVTWWLLSKMWFTPMMLLPISQSHQNRGPHNLLWKITIFNGVHPIFDSQWGKARKVSLQGLNCLHTKIIKGWISQHAASPFYSNMPIMSRFGGPRSETLAWFCCNKSHHSLSLLCLMGLIKTLKHARTQWYQQPCQQTLYPCQGAPVALPLHVAVGTSSHFRLKKATIWLWLTVRHGKSTINGGF